MKNFSSIRIILLFLALTPYLRSMEKSEIDFEEVTTVIPQKNFNISCFIFDENRNLLFCGTKKAGAIDVIDIKNPKEPILLKRFKAHQRSIRKLILTKEGTLISSAKDEDIKFWDISNLNNITCTAHLKKIICDWFTSIELHPSRNLLILGSHTGKVALVDIGDPKNPVICWGKCLEIGTEVSSLALHKDIIYVGLSNTSSNCPASLKILDIKNLKDPKIFSGPHIPEDRIIELKVDQQQKTLTIVSKELSPNPNLTFIDVYNINNPGTLTWLNSKMIEYKHNKPFFIQNADKNYVITQIDEKIKSSTMDVNDIQKYENALNSFNENTFLIFENRHLFSLSPGGCISMYKEFSKKDTQLIKKN